jgi:transcriptional regulator with XRE-family HTH domain
MMFDDRIKQLREARQMPQRKLAAALDIDTASYCKIECGERRWAFEKSTAGDCWDFYLID